MFVKIQNAAFLQTVQEVCRIALLGEQPSEGVIQISATNTGMVLEAENSIMGIRKELPAVCGMAVRQEGKVTLPAKYVFDLIRKIESDLTLESLSHHQMEIRSGGAKITLNSLPIQRETSFPKNTIKGSGTWATIGLEIMADMIRHTYYAQSKNDKKPVLSGAYFSLKKGVALMAATNSYRMAIDKRLISYGMDPASCIIPRQALNELHKLFQGQPGKAEFSIDHCLLRIQYENTIIYTRLIEGTFPDVERFFSKKAPAIAFLDTNSFLKVIERALLFSGRSEHKMIRLALDEEKKIQVSSMETEMGTIIECLEPESFEGGRNVCATVNGQYLKDALLAYKGKKVKLGFAVGMGPIAIEGEEDESHIHFISQVRHS
ncbi:DNA polymerase III subunit beta [Bacillus sp. 1P06AnD]|uniref:DNA polymerase III subunit beta n=1 Tax=Bacillus sp. 1P06AnD TaxID=3132208 RepID=UPI00399F9FEE